MRKPKNVSSLDNQVRSRRQTMGLSQQALATHYGCTRQAMNTFEGGLYVPSTLIALRLAKVLGCTVEELFRLPEEYPHIEAELVGEISVPEGRKTRLQVAFVGERVLAHPLTGAMAAFTAADGLLLAAIAAPTRRVDVELLVDAQWPKNTVVVVGCDPALALLGAHLLPRSVNDWRSRTPD